jgi:hypothetical protein
LAKQNWNATSKEQMLEAVAQNYNQALLQSVPSEVKPKLDIQQRGSPTNPT